MGNIDQNTAILLAVIVVMICLVVFFVDVVLFVRWIIYRFELHAYQPPPSYPLADVPVEAETGAAFPVPHSDTPSTAPAFDLPLAPDTREDAHSQIGIDPESEGTFLSEGEPIETGRVASSPESAGVPPAEPYPISPIVQPPFAPTWSLVDPFLLIQIAVAVQVLSQIPILFIGIGEMFKPIGLFLLIAGLMLTNVAFVVGVAFCLRRYGSSLKEIGLRAPAPKQILLGVGLGLLLFMLAAGGEKGLTLFLTHASPHLADRLSKITEALTAGGMFEQIHSNGWKLAFVLTGAVAAPIGEEVFFRGLLYNAFKKRWGMLAGIILSGLAFAILHAGPLAVVIIFPMGMILAYVYERTRSLWVTILMHMVNNGTAFLLAWFLPQLGK